MPNWTYEQYLKWVTRPNPKAGGLPPSPEPQQVVRHESVGPAPRKESHASRCVVRVVSFRRRLLDPDNLCPKYFIDALRYNQIIPNDRLEDIELQTAQVKVSRRQDERTEITISKL